MRILLIASALLATVPVAVAADAQPPRHGWHGHGDRHDRWRGGHRRCRTVWVHHHRERRCY